MSAKNIIENTIKKLPSEEDIKKMNYKELELLLVHLKQLNHVLGNGTLKTLKECTEKCKSMISFAGDLDAKLKDKQ